MLLKILSFLFLISFSNLVFSKAATIVSGAEGTAGISNQYEIIASKYPEIRLNFQGFQSSKGKIMRLKNNSIEFLPFPYWNVKILEIDLDDIDKISIEKQKSFAGRGAAGGFAVGFTIAGIIGLATSKYDSDYSSSILASSAIGGISTLIGLLSGGITDAVTWKKIGMDELSLPAKREIIKKIMGRAN